VLRTSERVLKKGRLRYQGIEEEAAGYEKSFKKINTRKA